MHKITYRIAFGYDGQTSTKIDLPLIPQLEWEFSHSLWGSQNAKIKGQVGNITVFCNCMQCIQQQSGKVWYYTFFKNNFTAILFPVTAILAKFSRELMIKSVIKNSKSFICSVGCHIGIGLNSMSKGWSKAGGFA